MGFPPRRLWMLLVALRWPAALCQFFSTSWRIRHWSCNSALKSGDFSNRALAVKAVTSRSGDEPGNLTESDRTSELSRSDQVEIDKPGQPARLCFLEDGC